MKRYIHTKGSTSILTYADKHAHRPVHMHCQGSRMHGHSSAHKIWYTLSLKVIILTLSGEWKGDREKGRESKEFKGGIEVKLDGEMKKKLHTDTHTHRQRKRIFGHFSGSASWQTVDACARAVPHAHVPRRWKRWTAALQDLPPQLTPLALIIHSPFLCTQDKEALTLKWFKAIGWFIYVCEPVGVALHDKDGFMGRVKSTCWCSFYFSTPVILLMDTGDAQPLLSLYWSAIACGTLIS